MSPSRVVKNMWRLQPLSVWLPVFTAVLVLSAVPDSARGAKPECGNGVCEGNESRTCPGDCGSPPTGDLDPSGGCETGLSTSEAKAGRRYVRDLLVDEGLTTQYEVRLPANYDKNSAAPHPLLVYLHGWGGSFRSLPTQFAQHAKSNGYLTVTPSGYGDGGPNSWNGFRSAKLHDCPTGYTAEDCDAGPPLGPSTCVDIDGSQFNYCYDSCGECPKWNDAIPNTWNGEIGTDLNGEYTCYWTTCRDSVAQIVALLNEVEADYCIDRSMIWVTGCSNGGMFVYELAKDARTSGRFAGYLPQVGAPHPGFAQAPPSSVTPPKYFMGFWGSSDTTVPGEGNFTDEVALDTNFNGWLYMTADSIANQWADMNGIETASATPVDYDASAYSSALDCKAWRVGPEADGAEIVWCFFQGGHSCPGFGNMPQMMWDFAESHPKPVPAEE